MTISLARLAPTPARPSGPRRAVRDLASRLAEGLATPFVPADYLDMVAPLRAGADLRGRIEAITPETADAATITIRPGRDWQGHVPGQYVRIGVDIDGVRRWRTYSLTSTTARRDGLISITVKAIAGGLVSNHLVHEARPGTLVMLDQATGDFVLPAQVPAKVLFLTGGSGITPVMGMLRNHDLAESDAVLLHSAPTAADVIFARDLAARRPGVEVVTRLTDTEGMLAPEMLDELVPDWRDRQLWACGPTPMLDVFEAFYAEQGLSDLVHVERFRPAVIEAGEGGQVTLVGPGTSTGKTVVDADGATPILDAAEEAGVLMPSGCRMGICFSCVLPMTDGAVRDLRNGEITETTPDAPPVKIQTCVTAAAGACTIETKEA